MLIFLALEVGLVELLQKISFLVIGFGVRSLDGCGCVRTEMYRSLELRKMPLGYESNWVC